MIDTAASKTTVFVVVSTLGEIHNGRMVSPWIEDGPFATRQEAEACLARVSEVRKGSIAERVVRRDATGRTLGRHEGYIYEVGDRVVHHAGAVDGRCDVTAVHEDGTVSVRSLMGGAGTWRVVASALRV